MTVCVFVLVAQLCLTLCDPTNRSTPGLRVHHQLPEFTQAHIHQVGDAIQPSHRPGDSLLPYPIILPFHTVHGVLKARILKSFAIPFSSGPHSIRSLHHACTSWVAPQGMA